MSKEPLARIVDKFYCNTCSKFINIARSCDEDRPKDIYCSECDSELKYKGGADSRVASTGNCGYQSAEKISGQNIKRIGRDAYSQMVDQDPILKHRKEGKKKENIPWYRKGLPDESKPLDLTKVKDTDKYIHTGAID